MRLGECHCLCVRRFALLPVVLMGLVLAGCGGTGRSQGTKPTGIASIAPRCAQYPRPGMTCSSPDGAWSVRYTRNPGTLWVTRLGPVSVRAYQSKDSCCTYITWAKPHTLLFDDDYRLMRLDPITRKHTMIASWSNFVVSPNGRWIAGWASGPPEEAETVGVLSVAGTTCLVVPHNPHQSDEAAGFTQDSKNVIVARSPFVPNNGTTGSPQLVQYAISSLRASKHC
jgi:hypothetical protein